ncbi:MAG: hypothetical protein DME61_10325 [Verrucomicrobia bacterium]|nr:MAG: hypothetical protein DME61_10325 [Verrucomicrobiota bacterium]
MSVASADAATDTAAAKRSFLNSSGAAVDTLLARFHQIRNFTNTLCSGLEPEDCVVQSMPDVSPTKWHLAHTTWFFETFILKKFVPGYRAEIPEYAYLFNSYYNAAGDMHRRDLRGLISRPTVIGAQRYRASVDSHIDDLLSGADEKLLDKIEPILVLGIHHEQQHQELLITDIKHVFAQNPLYPVFRGGDAALRRPDSGARRPYQFVDFEETTIAIGHNGDEFAYDNEGPRHQALVAAFSLASRPVTNGEYIEFIEDGGYTRTEFWLSLGWMTVNEQRWQAPLYWTKRDGVWWNFTLSNGIALHWIVRWKEISSKAKLFIRGRCPLQDTICVFIKCLATSGNGRAAPTRLIPVIARRRALSANTTASSCATNTFCVAVPAPRRAATFATRIAISSNQRNAGSLRGSDSHAIHNESLRQRPPGARQTIMP